MRRFVYYNAASVGASLLLDLYPATAAYSVRKLRTAYAGACIRVRRSSDNAESDIGFDINDDLDTAALLSFVGAGNGFIVSWYDQQGSNNFSNSVSTRQPIIVNSGVLVLSGLSNAIYMNKNVHHLTSTLSSTVALPVFVFAAVETISLSTNGFGNLSFIVNGASSGFQGRYEILAGTSNYQLQRRNTSGAVVRSLNAWSAKRTLITGQWKAAGLEGRQDGTDYAAVSYSGTAFTTASNWQLNHNTALNATALGIEARYMEVIIYHSDQAANRAAIETNINTYYGIY
jgi:hypothetical protein